VALQGTIDTFPLTDVLSLIGSSATTGRLSVDGDRGHAEIWVDAGRVVGGEALGMQVGDAAELVFELLRFDDAAFEFTAVASADLPEFELTPEQLPEALAAAAELRTQWDEIEAVVPSLAHRVRLVPELPEDELVVDAALWSVLVVAGTSPSIAGLGDELGLGEFGACAAVASLVERSLATVEEPSMQLAVPEPPAAPAPAPEMDDDAPSAAAWALEVAADPERSTAFPDRFPIDDLIGDDAIEQDDPWTSPEMEQLEAQRRADTETAGSVSFSSLPPIESVPFGGFGDPDGDRDAVDEQAEPEHTARTTAAAWDDMVEPEPAAADVAEGVATDDLRLAGGPSRAEEDTADEVLRQMSKLSPKAAEAIAAALSTVPAPPAGEERDDDQDDGGPVSFLGSF
jgi:hypothetical protein